MREEARETHRGQRKVSRLRLKGWRARDEKGAGVEEIHAQEAKPG
jgi:hypothetical protein